MTIKVFTQTPRSFGLLSRVRTYLHIKEGGVLHTAYGAQNLFGF